MRDPGRHKPLGFVNVLTFHITQLIIKGDIKMSSSIIHSQSLVVHKSQILCWLCVFSISSKKNMNKLEVYRMKFNYYSGPIQAWGMNFFKTPQLGKFPNFSQRPHGFRRPPHDGPFKGRPNQDGNQRRRNSCGESRQPQGDHKGQHLGWHHGPALCS